MISMYLIPSIFNKQDSDDSDQQQQQQQQQDCSEKMEDEDSNYESMAEDNNILGDDFQMSPPVVSVNQVSAALRDTVANGDNDDCEVALTTDSSNNSRIPVGRTDIKSSTSSTDNNKKNPRQNVQLRLNFNRSPSPCSSTAATRSAGPSRQANTALVYEEERQPAMEDFIVDDTRRVANAPNTSRKRISKKPRQSQINFASNANASSASTTQTNNTNRNNNNRTFSSATNRKQTESARNSSASNETFRQNNNNIGNRMRQQRIPLYEEIDLIDSNETTDTTNRNNILSGTVTSTVSRLSGAPIFRVKVRISNRCLLVPCQQAHEKTIEWLAQQVGDRIYSSVLSFPLVCSRKPLNEQ